MIKINNTRMLKAFSEAGENEYFYHCHDISMAGRDGYKIRKISYFVGDEADLLSSFLCVNEYYDDSLVVGVNSENETFWKEAADYICGLSANEVDVSSSCDGFFAYPYVAQRLSFGYSESGAPIYALLAPEDLPVFADRDGKSVSSKPRRALLRF